MYRNRFYHLIWVVLAVWIAAACQAPALISTGDNPDDSTGGAAERSTPTTLTVATHDSFNLSADLLDQFEAEHNADLQFLQLGDAGELVNQLVLSADAPLADVAFGVDNTFLSRALNADIFEPYASALLDDIPDDFQLDAKNRLLPADYGFVNLNADAAWFAERNLPLPQTLDDLAQPDYASALVVQNPATSSPGLAFLLATVSYFGEEGYLDFWQTLRDNGVLVVDGWSDAYYTYFTVGSGNEGERPLVVSYSTSPPADVLYATDGRTEPASVNISPPTGTFRQIEFVGILRNTNRTEAQNALARDFIDFMLSQPVQEDIPLQMFVYPANENAALPELFEQFATVPDEPASLAPEAIEANREEWIQAWTDVMLR